MLVNHWASKNSVCVCVWVKEWVLTVVIEVVGSCCVSYVINLVCSLVCCCFGGLFGWCCVLCWFACLFSELCCFLFIVSPFFVSLLLVCSLLAACMCVCVYVCSLMCVCLYVCLALLLCRTSLRCLSAVMVCFQVVQWLLTSQKRQEGSRKTCSEWKLFLVPVLCFPDCWLYHSTSVLVLVLTPCSVLPFSLHFPLKLSFLNYWMKYFSIEYTKNIQEWKISNSVMVSLVCIVVQRFYCVATLQANHSVSDWCFHLVRGQCIPVLFESAQLGVLVIQTKLLFITRYTTSRQHLAGWLQHHKTIDSDE